MYRQSLAQFIKQFASFIILKLVCCTTNEECQIISENHLTKHITNIGIPIHLIQYINIYCKATIWYREF